MKRYLIILFIFLANTVLGVRYNPDGSITPDIDWYVDNIKEKRYEIHTINELAGFAALVNGTTGFFTAYDFTGKVVVLANDIDMESAIDEWGCYTAPVWVPIGMTYSTRFAGTFDGQGYCIKNLVIKNVQTGTLFGYNGGTIKNLVIAGGMICSDYYGAGVCSHNSGVVDHCINTASIYCHNYGGGICGKNYGEGRISNCINLGYVLNGNYCGGVVGSNAVSGTDIINCVYDNQICPLKRGCGNIEHKNIRGLSTASIIKGSGFDSEVGFVVTPGMYPRLSLSDTSACLSAALAPVVLADGQNVEAVTKSFGVPPLDGVEYQTSNPEYFDFENGSAVLKTKSCASVIIRGGGCIKIINLRITANLDKVVGEETSPLRIRSFDDFRKFANAVNNCMPYNGFACMDGFKNVSFVLTDNIRIPSSVKWEPIGSVNNPFNGVFKGFGFAISNLNLLRSQSKYTGLFGYNRGHISKVVLVDGQVIGGDYTASVCGFNAGTIEKCLNSIPVRGHYYSGGICGYNNGGSLLQCINVNSVAGVDEYTGGICGASVDGAMRFCVSDRQMCPDVPVVGQQDGTIMFQSQTLDTEDMVGDKLRTSVKDGFNLDFLFTDNLYPRVISTARHPEALVASTPVYVAPHENVLSIYSYVELRDIVEEDLPVKYVCNQQEILRVSIDKALPLKQGAVVFTLTNGRTSKKVTMRIVNEYLESVGSVDNPLLVATYRDLEKFRNAVNQGTDYKGFACIDGFRGVHFQLKSNIACPSGVLQIPIGNNLAPFNGVFDGNNKIISNFSAQYDNRDNVGFIGYNAGEVRQLRMSRSPMRGRYYTGGIVGYNAGLVENCFHDSASVSGTNYAGGICGYDTGRIVRCYNNAPVKCDYYAGGICGSNSGRVDTCINTGIINGSSCVGGITGSNNAEVEFCFNSASITGIDNTGGISGRNVFSVVTSCHNKGVVNGGDCAGGVVGLNDGTVRICGNDTVVIGTQSVGGIAGRGGKIYYCSNNGQVTSSGNNAGGIIGTTKGNSDVRFCSSKGNVTSKALAGGICAENKEGGKICSNISFGSINASNYVGGICGYNSGTISNSIFVGKTSGGSSVGSVCGKDNSGYTEHCVYDKTLSTHGGIDSADAEGKAVGVDSALLKDGNSLSGFMNSDDFVLEAGKYPASKTPSSR
ncbi:MAG: hypothetical protein MJZ61_02870 [Bacteroidales bacterium]|nr:hypothetical protein [Bacteroidales bacterium]